MHNIGHIHRCKIARSKRRRQLLGQLDGHLAVSLLDDLPRGCELFKKGGLNKPLKVERGGLRVDMQLSVVNSLLEYLESACKT